MTTLAPSWLSSLAMASPSPLDAPVTSATLFFSPRSMAVECTANLCAASSLPRGVGPDPGATLASEGVRLRRLIHRHTLPAPRDLRLAVDPVARANAHLLRAIRSRGALGRESRGIPLHR